MAIDRDGSERERVGRRSAPARWAPLLHLLCGLGAACLVTVMLPQLATPRATAGIVSPAVARTLADCQQKVAVAREAMARRPEEGRTALRVASLETCLAQLLALAAYEREHPEQAEATEAALAGDLVWRERFMRADPEATWTRASDAARAALACELTRPERVRAFLLLANARAALGDDHGELEALLQAVYTHPDQAALWLRLADAWGRTREFARAEGARAQALALLESRAPGGTEAGERGK